MRQMLIIPLAALLAGCTGEAEDHPRLLPTDQILAEPTLPDHPQG